MKKITEKQAKFLRSLLQQAGRTADVDRLSRWEACKLISQLVDERNARGQSKQAELALPLLPPLVDPEILPELAEFKRWAREIYQRGELTIHQLGELQDARFGPLKMP